MFSLDGFHVHKLHMDGSYRVLFSIGLHFEQHHSMCGAASVLAGVLPMYKVYQYS